MKIVLMHGKDSDPSQKWYPWFIDQMKSLGHKVHAPALPDASDPHIEAWLAELDELSPDDATVLVGHSRGGVAILRWLEKQPDSLKVKMVVLLATNDGSKQKMAIPSESNHGFYTEAGYDFDAIKAHCDNFVVMHSKDDPWVPYSAGVDNAAGLNAEFISFDNLGHFGRGVEKISKLIELINI